MSIPAVNRQADVGTDLRKGPGFTDRSGFKSWLCHHLFNLTEPQSPHLEMG